MGIYPMTAIRSQADVKNGLDRLATHGLVSVVVVADPQARPQAGQLAAAFGLRRAGRRCLVEQVRLADHMLVWTQLYDGILERRAIFDTAAFGEPYFSALARGSRMIALAAYVEEPIVAMAIWLEHDGVVYNHHNASDAQGYANGANYALYEAAISLFSGAAVLSLGNGSGAHDGLAVFKRSFANSDLGTLLCSLVLDDARYSVPTDRLLKTAYFPS
jgi:hypothetical protein